jgi:hypothetical protein
LTGRAAATARAFNLCRSTRRVGHFRREAAAPPLPAAHAIFDPIVCSDAAKNRTEACSDSAAYGATAGFAGDRRVRTSKQVGTRTIARRATQSFGVADRHDRVADAIVCKAELPTVAVAAKQSLEAHAAALARP